MEILDENLISLDADVKTAEDCIRHSGALFLQHGYVKEGYPDAVVKREQVYPTGLPGKGLSIAIPHTNNELVIKPAVGVIIPREPVEFSMMGDKDTKLQCEIIMPLVIKDSKMQINMLKKMMKVIQDSELLIKIKNAKSKSEVIEYLSILEEI